MQIDVGLLREEEKYVLFDVLFTIPLPLMNIPALDQTFTGCWKALECYQKLDIALLSIQPKPVTLSTRSKLVCPRD